MARRRDSLEARKARIRLGLSLGDDYRSPGGKRSRFYRDAHSLEPLDPRAANGRALAGEPIPLCRQRSRSRLSCLATDADAATKLPRAAGFRLAGFQVIRISIALGQSFPSRPCAMKLK